MQLTTRARHLNVPGLLEEVSRRGIPILKRLAGGGSQSRGELGLLLTTRLLQDSFRPGANNQGYPFGTETAFILCYRSILTKNYLPG